MSVKPQQVLEIFLQPGELYFGDEGTRIRTLLGSCISITLWHPKRRIGGMCHYMLPSRGKHRPAAPDGRYADEVFAMFLAEIAKAKTYPSEYEVKLFGGGNMFPHGGAKKIEKRSPTSPMRRKPVSISLKNLDAGRRLIEQHGFRIRAEDAGGNGQRHVIFDVWSGHVWVRRNKAMDTP